MRRNSKIQYRKFPSTPPHPTTTEKKKTCIVKKTSNW